MRTMLFAANNHSVIKLGGEGQERARGGKEWSGGGMGGPISLHGSADHAH